MSLNAVTYILRVAVFVAPVLAFLLTKRICIGLQRSDEERLLHGAETGIIERDPSGAYTERHAPISQGEAYTLTQHAEPMAMLPMGSDTDGLSDKEIKAEELRRKASRFFYVDTLRTPTRAELEDAAHHHDGDDHGNGHELEDGHNGNGHNGNGHHAIAAGGKAQNATHQ